MSCVCVCVCPWDCSHWDVLLLGLTQVASLAVPGRQWVPTALPHNLWDLVITLSHIFQNSPWERC